MIRAAKPLLFALCAACSGCSDESRQGVDYSSMDKTLGRWPAKTQTQQVVTPAPDKPAAEPSARDAATDSGDEPVEDEDAGASPGAGKPTEEKPQPGAAATKPPRLTFSVLTQVKYLRVAKSDPTFDDDARGPKNMGAIWISKPDGSFVRSLEVWRLHKQRKEHLVGFNKACECAKPDVIATATLEKHREHTTSWDLTDRDGATVPEGTYTLHIEVADYDVANPERLNKEASNAHWQLDFDTKSAPNKLMPPDVEFFKNLELELLKP